MNTLITFSGSGYHETTRRIVEDGPKFGADRVLVYDDAWLRAHPFYQLNRWIFEHEPRRCYGYCAWKALIVLDALERTAGNPVLYTDADCYPVGDLRPLFTVAARDGAMLFKSQTHKQYRWCKADAYLVTGATFDTDADAGCARFAAFAGRGWRERQFLYEWLTYSVNPFANTKSVSALGIDVAGFEEHRDEQAIMTLLAHRYGYKLWREADQGGAESQDDRDVYGDVFHQVHQGGSCDESGSAFRNV